MDLPRSTAELLDAARRAGTARPLVTFYDDATGERIELSTTTFGNWVAKTAGLLDEIGVARGDRVAFLLPVHWQSTVFLVSCWEIGAVPVVGSEPEDCVAAVASADRLDEAVALGVDTTIGASLDAFGRPLSGAPDGVVNYADEVPGYPDDLFVADPPEPGDPALAGADGTLSGTRLIELAGEYAKHRGLDAGSRLLSEAAPDSLDGVLASAVVPLALGGSVVLCRNLDPAVLERRIETERVTKTAG
ncbi:MAG: TIGR03089 family protein [Streptosporangiales bacterium]